MQLTILFWVTAFLFQPDPVLSPSFNESIKPEVYRADYLSEFENEVLAEMNLLRSNPSDYAEKYVKPLFNEDDPIIRTRFFKTEGKRVLRETYKRLHNTEPLPLLKPNRGLTLAASDHAVDQSKNGKTGHKGSDGSLHTQRMERYGRWKGLSGVFQTGENIAYGYDNAHDMVLALVIDDGVPDRGHRENLLNARYFYCGIAKANHPVYQTLCVITYATEFVENKK